MVVLWRLGRVEGRDFASQRAIGNAGDLHQTVGFDDQRGSAPGCYKIGKFIAPDLLRFGPGLAFDLPDPPNGIVLNA